MAKKKKPGRNGKTSETLRKAFKELGVIEKDLERVRENLRRFLNRPARGSKSYDTRKKKVPR